MKGRPILGIIAGFMFGLFLGITLVLYGVIPLHSDLPWILPLVGIVLGLLFAAWAPFGNGAETSAAPPLDHSPGGELIDHNPPLEPPPAE